MEYALLDSGHGRKLEKFGKIILNRPSLQAIWAPRLPLSSWNSAHALFEREGGNKWINKNCPDEWEIHLFQIKLKLKKTEFGHIGLFPEHMTLWEWVLERLKTKPQAKILNLFAYSGGATLAMAKTGASVCHLDASKSIVNWARENAALNHLEKAPIRWIVDDVKKYLARAVRRGETYDGILLDPPTFGRGTQGELFKIEADLEIIIKDCMQLLSSTPLFFLLSCHTPGLTPLVLKQLLQDYIKYPLEEGELFLTGKDNYKLPMGTFVRCHYA